MASRNTSRKSVDNDQENTPLFERLSKAKTSRTTGPAARTPLTSSSPAKESDALANKTPSNLARATPPRTHAPSAATRASGGKDGRSAVDTRARAPTSGRLPAVANAPGTSEKTVAPKMSTATLRRLAASQADKSVDRTNSPNSSLATPKRPSPQHAGTSRARTASPTKPSARAAAASKTATSAPSAKTTMTRRLPVVPTSRARATANQDTSVRETPSPTRAVDSPAPDDEGLDDRTPSRSERHGPSSTDANSSPIASNLEKAADRTGSPNDFQKTSADEITKLKEPHVEESKRLERALREAEESADHQKNECGHMQEKVERSNAEISNLQVRISDLAKEGARKVEVIERLQREVEDLNNDIRDLSATKARNNALHHELLQLRERIRAYENQIAKLDRESDMLQEKHDQERALKEANEDYIATLQKEKQELDFALEQFETDLEAANENIVELEALNKGWAAKENELEEIRRDHAAETSKRQAAERAQREAENNYENARQKIIGFEHESRKRAAVEKSLEEGIENYKRFNLDLQRKHRAEVDDLMQRLAETQQELEEALEDADPGAEDDNETVKEFLKDYHQKLGLDGGDADEQNFDVHDCHHKILQELEKLMRIKNAPAPSTETTPSGIIEDSQQLIEMKKFFNQYLATVRFPANYIDKVGLKSAHLQFLNMLETLQIRYYEHLACAEKKPSPPQAVGEKPPMSLEMLEEASRAAFEKMAAAKSKPQDQDKSYDADFHARVAQYTEALRDVVRNADTNGNTVRPRAEEPIQGILSNLEALNEQARGSVEEKSASSAIINAPADVDESGNEGPVELPAPVGRDNASLEDPAAKTDLALARLQENISSAVRLNNTYKWQAPHARA